MLGQTLLNHFLHLSHVLFFSFLESDIIDYTEIEEMNDGALENATEGSRISILYFEVCSQCID